MRPSSSAMRLGDLFKAGPSRRAFSSTPAAAEGSAYPFSKKAVFPKSTLTGPPAQNLLTPRNGAHVVTHVNTALKRDYDPASLLQTLFSRRSPQRLRTGSVVSVLSYSTPAKTGIMPFSGVLMRVRRRGVDTAFTLRNVVQKTGVEMNFKVCSPMIKEIKVVRRAEGRSGIADLRRARVNYLRDRPGVMSQIAGALKAHNTARVAAAAQ